MGYDSEGVAWIGRPSGGEWIRLSQQLYTTNIQVYDIYTGWGASWPADTWYFDGEQRGGSTFVPQDEGLGQHTINVTHVEAEDSVTFTIVDDWLEARVAETEDEWQATGEIDFYPSVEYEFKLRVDGGLMGDLSADSYQWYVQKKCWRRIAEVGGIPVFVGPSQKLCLVLGEQGQTFTHVFDEPGPFALRCRFAHGKQVFEREVAINVAQYVGNGGIGAGSDDRLYMTLPRGTQEVNVYFTQVAKTGTAKPYARFMRGRQPEHVGVPVTRDEYNMPIVHEDEGWYKIQWDRMDQKGIVKMSCNYSCVVHIPGAPHPFVSVQGPFYSHYLDEDGSPSQVHGDAVSDFLGVPIDHGGRPVAEEVLLYGAADILRAGKWSCVPGTDPKGLIAGLTPVGGGSVDNAEGVKVKLNRGAGAHFEVGDSARIEYRRAIGEYKEDGSIKKLPVVREVTLVTVDVESVQWERFRVIRHLLYGTQWNPELTECPNNGGLRIFPGKTIPEDEFPFRNVVGVRAKLAAPAPVSGVKLWFRVFDVDDPSADTAPVDDEQNRPKHSDNRPSSAGIGARFANNNTVYCISLGSGRISEVVYLGLDSIQPGNNWVVAASCSEEYVRGITVDPTDGVTLRDANGNEIVTRTPMLTCWRKLHVDLDSMASINGNLATGEIKAVQHDPPNNRTKLILGDIEPDSFDEPGHFDSLPGATQFPLMADGKIQLQKGTSCTGLLIVVDDEIGAGDDTVYVQLDTSLSSYGGGQYTLYDDDHWSTWHIDTAKRIPEISLPHTLSIDLLSSALAKAYVEPEPYDQQEDNPFELNSTDWDHTESNLCTSGSNQWWVVHLIAAYQGPPEKDEDPEKGEFVNGITDCDLLPSGAFVFLETLREFAMLTMPGGEITAPEHFRRLEDYTVAHEAGHQLGLDHCHGSFAGTTYIMAGEVELGEHMFPDNMEAYSPTSIARIRDLDHAISAP